MYFNHLENVVNTLFEHNVTPLLVGHRGLGKTEFVYQYGKKHGYKVINLRVGQMADAGDLIGLADFAYDELGNKVSSKFFAPEYLRTQDEKVILFLDEINRARKDIIQAIFELVYDKSISLNGFKLNDNSRIIAAQNPATEEYNLLDFADSAYSDRFCHIKFNPSIEEWVSYINNKFNSPSFSHFIKQNPKNLEPSLSEFTLDVKPSRRSGETFIKIEQNETNKEVLKTIGFGLLGVETYLEYIGWKKENDKIISGKQILDNYPKQQKRIKALGQEEIIRTDLIKKITDNVEKELLSRESLTLDQESNLLNFIMDLPKDFGFGFSRSLINPNFEKAQQQDHVLRFYKTETQNQELYERFIGHIKSFLVNSENKND